MDRCVVQSVESLDFVRCVVHKGRDYKWDDVYYTGGMIKNGAMTGKQGERLAMGLCLVQSGCD